MFSFCFGFGRVAAMTAGDDAERSDEEERRI
jgi:hypothetical protein